MATEILTKTTHGVINRTQEEFIKSLAHGPRVEFERMKEVALLPTRATDGSAGLDLYTPRPFAINGTQHTMIKLGIKSRFNPGWVALIKDRSGLAAKEGLTTLAGVIDSDYRGEWAVVLHNTNPNISEHIEFKAQDRIAQVIFVPVWTGEVKEVLSVEDDTDRGGGFGSTGA